MFTYIVNSLNFNIVDEFKWYLIYDLKTTLTEKKEEENALKSINNYKMALYMSILVSTLICSPYFEWNALNENGLNHLAASISFISSDISTFTNNDMLLFGYEHTHYMLIDKYRSFKSIPNFFINYSVDALPTDVQYKYLQTLQKEVLANTIENYIHEILK